MVFPPHSMSPFGNFMRLIAFEYPGHVFVHVAPWSLERYTALPFAANKVLGATSSRE